MNTTYQPVVAAQEMHDFTIDEVRFAQKLGKPVKGLVKILNGERPKESTMDFLDRMIKEAEEIKAEDFCSGK